MNFRAANIFSAKIVQGEKLFWAANYFRVANDLGATNYPRAAKYVL